MLLLYSLIYDYVSDVVLQSKFCTPFCVKRFKTKMTANVFNNNNNNKEMFVFPF